MRIFLVFSPQNQSQERRLRVVGDEVEVSQGLALLVAEVLHDVGLKVLLEEEIGVVEFKLKIGKLNEKSQMRKCESEASV